MILAHSAKCGPKGDWIAKLMTLRLTALTPSFVHFVVKEPEIIHFACYIPSY